MTCILLHNVDTKDRDKGAGKLTLPEFPMKIASRLSANGSANVEAIGDLTGDSKLGITHCTSVSSRVKRLGGFTLVEVVLTLGIVAIFIGILAMFPQMLDQSRASNMETRASRIARQIVTDLAPSPKDLLNNPQASQPAQNPFIVPKGHVVLESSPTDCVTNSVDLSYPESIDLWYDLNGRPVGSESSLVAFQAKVTITPDAVRWGLSQVLIQVQAPDSLPTAPRYSFSTKIAIPASVRQSTSVTASNP